MYHNYWRSIQDNEYDEPSYEELLFVDMPPYHYMRSSPKSNFTTEEALWIARTLNIQFNKFDVEQFRVGLVVELEHGSINPFTNITNDDPILTGKIALAHLNEFSDYYTRLTKMEEEAEEYWEKKDRLLR